MSLRAGWFAICERSAVDRDRGNVSLFECIEAVAAPTFPAVLIRFEMVLYLLRDHDGPLDAAPCGLRFLAEPPGRPEVLLAASEFNFPAGEWRMRVRVPVSGLEMLTPGVYHFRAELDVPDGAPQVMGRLPLEVVPAPGTEPVHGAEAGAAEGD